MTLPLENLDDKAFNELVKEAISRIPVYSLEWTDHNRTDPGISIIEMLAWLVEMQVYRLNKVGDRDYLKFLRFLGIKGISPARAARVDLTFSLFRDSSISIPAGTGVAAIDPGTGGEIVFETDRDLNVVNAGLQKVLTVFRRTDLPESHSEYVTIIDNTYANISENAYYNAFRSDPQQNDALLLGLDASLSGQEPSFMFYLREEYIRRDDERATAQLHGHMPSPARLAWEYYAGGDWKSDSSWRALSPKAEGLHFAVRDMVEDGTGNLLSSGEVRVKILGEMERTAVEGKDLFWIRAVVKEPDYYTPPKIDRIALNTVRAVQKASRRASFSSSGLPCQEIMLKESPVLDGSLRLQVDNDGYEWSLVEDLDASGPGDRHYTLDCAAGKIAFGNGVQGKVPPKGMENIIVSYSYGGGVVGNVRPHSINKVLEGNLAKAMNVDNEMAAKGGEDTGTLEEAIGEAQRSLREVHRAVTPSDYEYLAMNAPGVRVKRAKAVPMYHPIHDSRVPDTISVIVVPLSARLNPMPDARFREAVYRHLNKHRLVGTELFVISPTYVRVCVEAVVIRRHGYKNESVQASVLERLNGFLSPMEGGENGKGWPFGRNVYRSEVYAVIDGAEGVDYVRSLALWESKRGSTGSSRVWAKSEGNVSVPPHGLIYSREGLEQVHKITVYSEEEYNRLEA